MIRYICLALIVNSLVLTACGKELPQDLQRPFDPKRNQEIVREPAFEPLMRKFEELTGRSTEHVSTRFEKLDGMLAGLCLSWDDGQRDIEIDEEFWAQASELEKENLILHEAGHCVLNLDHIEDLIRIGRFYIPSSIMYPSIFGSSPFYANNRDYYHEELKSHASK